jgi:hypothetical protein
MGKPMYTEIEKLPADRRHPHTAASTVIWLEQAAANNAPVNMTMFYNLQQPRPAPLTALQDTP